MTGAVETVVRRTEPVMGTAVSFDIHPGDLPLPEVYLALARARAALHKVDAVFSTWKPESPLSRLRRDEIALSEAPAEVGDVLELVSAGSQRVGWLVRSLVRSRRRRSHRSGQGLGCPTGA